MDHKLCEMGSHDSWTLWWSRYYDWSSSYGVAPLLPFLSVVSYYLSNIKLWGRISGEKSLDYQSVISRPPRSRLRLVDPVPF